MSTTYAVAVSMVLACAGCVDAPSYACPDPSRPCREPDAAPPRPCAGPCVEPSPDDWSNPLLLWIGAPGTEPPCPPSAPHRDYDGHADPVDDPASCSACACAPPAGACGPPPLLTANAAVCADVGLGVARIPFASPALGGCTASAPLPPSCGIGPCAMSVTLAPLSVAEGGCAPSTSLPAPNDPSGPRAVTWGTSARACALDVPGACDAPGAVCTPAAGAGFSRCIRARGTAACPPAFPIAHTFFDDADDGRGCSPCTCGAPAGSLCTGTVSLYQDSLCAAVLDVIAVASSGPVCLDVQPPGSGPGSTRVSMVAYQPGACPAAGGDPIGSITPTGPTTFCCTPEP